jgi:hypothetical protein
VMGCSGIEEYPAAQYIVDSSTRHLMQRVFLGILELALAGLTLAVRGLRWYLSMSMSRSHTT